MPHRFLLDSDDSSRIQCIPEEWKLAKGSANTAILGIPHSRTDTRMFPGIHQNRMQPEYVYWNVV